MMRHAKDVDLLLVAVGCLLAVAMAVLGVPAAIRAPLGIVAALVLPGYSAGMALFPPGELDGVERSALSFSLSLGIIILVAPFLGLTPGGFDAATVVTAVSAVTLLSTAVAWGRRRRRRGKGQMPDGAPVDRPRWQGTARRYALIVVGIGAIASVAILAFDLGARPGTTTEFYVLGPDGTAGGLPAHIKSGIPTTVTVGIANHDGSAQPYQVVVESGSERIAAIGPVSVGSGNTWTGSVDFTVPTTSDQPEIRILLLRGSDAQPYRSLRLDVDSSAPASSERSPSPIGS